MWVTRLAFMADTSHVVSMNTDAEATQITSLQALIAEPTNAQALLCAADRLANAERSVRISTGLCHSPAVRRLASALGAYGKLEG